MTCVITDEGKFYPQIFIEKYRLLNKYGIQQDGEIGGCQTMRKKHF